MKKYINVLFPFFIIPFFLTACVSPAEIETVSTETFITDMTTTTETEEETEFTDNGEKIITFQISKEACEEWYKDTPEGVTEFINSGTDWVIEDDFVSVVDKKKYVELKMSESDIVRCRKRMFEYLGVGPSDRLEKDSFFYYNDEYNKIVAYIRKEENSEALFNIGKMGICLMTLQMLEGIDSDEWNVDVTIINPETGNVVIEMDGHKKYEISDECWK